MDAFFGRSDWNFAGKEGYAWPADMPMPPFEHGVGILTMRNPIARIYSHYRHGMLQCEVNPKLRICQFKTFKDMIWNFLPEHPMFANMFTYELGGFTKNQFSYDAEHLNLAKARLKYFSVILLADGADVFQRSANMLKRKLCWKNVDATVARSGSRVQKIVADVLADDPETLRRLINLTMPDLELYETAKAMAHLEELKYATSDFSSDSDDIIGSYTGRSYAGERL